MDFGHVLSFEERTEWFGGTSSSKLTLLCFILAVEIHLFVVNCCGDPKLFGETTSRCEVVIGEVTPLSFDMRLLGVEVLAWRKFPVSDFVSLIENGSAGTFKL
jgi:hypothetical protein